MTTDWNDALTGVYTRYSEWNGNVNERGVDSELVTDGRMMYRSDVADEKRHRKLAGDANETRHSEPEKVEQVWQGLAVASWDLEPVTLIDMREASSGTQYAKLDVRNGQTVYANAQYLRILYLLTEFDEVRGHPEADAAALVCYRNGEPVALFMPRRTAPDQEWATMKPVKTSGGWTPPAIRPSTGAEYNQNRHRRFRTKVYKWADKKAQENPSNTFRASVNDESVADELADLGIDRSQIEVTEGDD